ncbi:MAG: undecaprenyldiphospho-muramoylpentapeptide beta-N-acetylglucosaminyltransferase [Ignavibacteria bacterium]|jgi:UDP-N-acetylglucosamine--N-acetylmuramyl-(pentapeptide) pyrophosphoryl-undecaprenol N-acetylglucosamine transferase
MKTRTPYRFVIGSGGTGGHLYPAIAVVEQIRNIKADAEFLFVGTKDKIESRVVPDLGYKFKTIWISGFARKITLKNILFPLKLLVSLIQSFFINMVFKPRVAIGCGAYVSGPVVWTADALGAKILLMEQNSFPGITNRLLEKNADEIHLSFEESKKYFRFKDKLRVTGNPVRINLKLKNKEESKLRFGLDKSKKTLLILGGSLGAGSINKAVKENLEVIIKNDIQVIWQTGKEYYNEYKDYESDKIKVNAFIDDMSSAYSAADLVIARAGATTIAEVSFLGLAVVFVPSKNVAENHQYKNAKTIVGNDAALMIKDNDLEKDFMEVTLKTINDENKIPLLKENIKKFSKPDAARIIAERAISLAELN